MPGLKATGDALGPVDRTHRNGCVHAATLRLRPRGL